MARAKASRDTKRQLGQYMTPTDLSRRAVELLPLSVSSKVLEPSFGDGSFLIALIERFMAMYTGSTVSRLERVLSSNIYGVEIDSELYERALENIRTSFGPVPNKHNLYCQDFFRDWENPCLLTDSDSRSDMPANFDVIVGNPPYGGTFDPDIEDALDRKYGQWAGHKLKKETYSFFIARALDLLQPGGELLFISSDTFLTIKTMLGLRRRLMDQCTVEVESLSEFSQETVQPTLFLHARKTGKSNEVTVEKETVPRELIEITGNFSWRIDATAAPYFKHPARVGDFLVCTGGMTIGKNEYFLRPIHGDCIEEPYEFSFFEDRITVEGELKRARLNKLSPKKIAAIEILERQGITRRNVRIAPRSVPLKVRLPDSNYAYYNKASSGIVYAPPNCAIYWENDGDAVMTFKKNGNWYLHGVGGKPYFGRSGITWQLISSRLNARYLPSGYILDTGAPCGFLRPGVNEGELWFILGWLLCDEATDILKTVINHTRNIQGKDVEKLPYPIWVDPQLKAEAISFVKNLVEEAVSGQQFSRSDAEIRKLTSMYSLNG